MLIGTFKDERDNVIEVSWEEVTPDIARAWLERNVGHNRTLNNAQVVAISDDIRDGFWQFNGASVAFDWNGDMLDAQHRCHAIIVADTPVHMLVLRGLDPEAMKLMGQERPRSTRDLLITSGREMTHASETVALASIIVQSDPALIKAVNTRPRLADYVWEHRAEMQPVAAWAKGVVNTTTLWIDPAHPYANGKNDRKAITSSALGALVYVMVHRHGADFDVVTAFWEGVMGGVGTPEDIGHIKAIRNYLSVTAPLLRIGGGGSVANLFKTYDTMIRTYNRRMSGESVTRVQQGRVIATDIPSLTVTRR